ncbi:elongation factor P [Desulfohalobiaceae bacterium Ax17]|jgi:elongation factor P|uniref:elongation factor P n=1 Tax=Desulfovulcanus ferrireducens TaxID=2831190 RepID=UPI00207BA6B2|nr:elongation factor P [Desulfovulcanus ferrireducens]MBT8762353.1 elongation factor P [Desulfovulcanus ferrireducens]
MLSTTDFRRGLKIEIDGTPYEIVDFLHVKPGKGGAFVRTKLKNLLTGGVVDQTFRSGEKVGKPDLETREMQYLYHDGSGYVFMDLTTYEQINVPDETLKEKGGFLKDGQEVRVLVYNGQPIDMDLPAAVILEVTETEPGLKGDTVSGATKPATLETGLVVNVPLFINTGDKIKVDTRTKEYLGRES